MKSKIDQKWKLFSGKKENIAEIFCKSNFNFNDWWWIQTDNLPVVEVQLLNHCANITRYLHRRTSKGATAIALWFYLRLPSCGPGFKSQAHHHNTFWICIIEIDESKRKRGRVRPIFRRTSKQLISVPYFGTILLPHTLETFCTTMLEILFAVWGYYLPKCEIRTTKVCVCVRAEPSGAHQVSFRVQGVQIMTIFRLKMVTHI